jgi:VPS62-like protein
VLTARRLVLVVLVLVVLETVPAQAQGPPSAAQRLAERYAPVLSIEPQPKPCGPGEAYRPTTVDIVLGRRDVLLRDPDGKVVTRAPTSSDLWALADGYYLDVPGDPLEPGCRYERQFRNWNDHRPPSVYAHVATDPSHPGKLSVQYWFYYTFNDFTDKHESDWEMAQVDFDAPSAAEALRKSPYEVDLSQHAGGERSDWTNTKLQKQGTHPVIYAATGSHANYFSSALYLGRSAREGFGCDDTGKATQQVDLRPVLLPEIPSSASVPYAWLAFQGRWGQREAGINNGPTGPGMKPQWLAPIEWADSLRTTSVEVPSGTAFGLSVGTFFCRAVTGAAVGLNWSLNHPVPFLALLLLVLIGLLASVAATTWRPPDARPVRMERKGGQIFRATTRIYAEHLPTFAVAGVIFVPVYLVAAAIQWVLFHLTSVAPLIALDGRHGAATAFLAILIGGVGGLFASVIATATVAVILDEIDAGRRILAGQAYRCVFRRLRPLAGAMASELLMVFLLTITVVGIPIAVHRFIRWSLFAQAGMLGDLSASESLRRSSELVRRRWWRTFGFTLLVDVLAVLSGPLLGVGLLLLTDHSLNFINLAASLVYTFTVPYAAIQLTLYYFDLEARGVVKPAPSDARQPIRPTVRPVLRDEREAL